MQSNSKQGVYEAKNILMKKGFTFDETYFVDNSSNSKPDLKFLNGRFLEVTNMSRDNVGVTKDKDFSGKPRSERSNISGIAGEAWNRIQRDDYEKDGNDKYTDKGKAKFIEDKKILSEYYGYDWESKKRRVVNCDLIGVSFSRDNILKEMEDKGQKYPKGNVELFIFVLKEEYASVLDDKEAFLEKAKTAPFKKVYLCVWDIIGSKYEIENPQLLMVDFESMPPSIVEL